MTGKNLTKHHYARKKIVTLTKYRKYVEDITDKVCKDFEIRKVREYHDLYPQSDTWLLVDVVDFRNVLKYMNLVLQNFVRLLDQDGKQL